MAADRLNLNEALLTVNKINLTSALEVYYKIDECFGCSTTKLTSISAGTQDYQEVATSDVQQQRHQHQDQYVISTKHNFLLELRKPNSLDTLNGPVDSVLCILPDVSLNSHGQYRLDVSPHTALAGARTNSSVVSCSIETVDSGECLLCPFAILTCILFALVVFEQLYDKFWRSRRDSALEAQRRVSRKLSSTAGVAVNCDADSSGSGIEGAQSGDTNHDYGGQGHPTSNDLRHQRQSNASTSSSLNDRRALDNQTRASEASDCKRRIECLDIFRGFTLACMIFVNYGGAGYASFEHKAWNGITLADFVFPFFIFSMGASIAISVKSLIARHQKSFYTIALSIFRRSLILALLGICLNSKWVDYEQADGLKRLRLTGVLQRFSISYLVVAFMYSIELTINKWTRAQSLSNVPYLNKLISASFEMLTAVNYMAIHIYLTYYFNFNPLYCPVGYTGPGGATEGGRYANCTGGTAAWLDRLVLGDNHMYNDHEVKKIFRTKISHDPEGILGYTTSILLTLLGLQCGKILTNNRRTHKQKLILLSQWLVALSAASSMIIWIPVNKRLWSLSFIVVTALAAFTVIIALYIFIDIYHYRKSFLIRLLSSAGKNSIFLYVGHSLLYNMLPWWFPLSDQTSHLQLVLRLSWSTFMWLLIAHYMALKGLFIKV